jgi:hypothetical protein
MCLKTLGASLIISITKFNYQDFYSFSKRIINDYIDIFLNPKNYHDNNDNKYAFTSTPPITTSRNLRKNTASNSNDVNHISILNLDQHDATKPTTTLNQKYYSQFKNFVDKVVDNLINEVGNNIGDIIQFHLFEEETINEKDKAKFMEMFNQYKKEYSDYWETKLGGSNYSLDESTEEEEFED